MQSNDIKKILALVKEKNPSGFDLLYQHYFRFLFSVAYSVLNSEKDSYVRLMHTLFTLEDNYGLKISEMDGEVCLKVDVRKSKDSVRLHEMLCSWQQAAAMLEAGEISKEDYDKWRYHYPEFDKAQTYVKVPPQDLF